MLFHSNQHRENYHQAQTVFSKPDTYTKICFVLAQWQSGYQTTFSTKSVVSTNDITLRSVFLKPDIYNISFV